MLQHRRLIGAMNMTRYAMPRGRPLPAWDINNTQLHDGDIIAEWDGTYFTSRGAIDAITTRRIIAVEDKHGNPVGAKYEGIANIFSASSVEYVPALPEGIELGQTCTTDWRPIEDELMKCPNWKAMSNRMAQYFVETFKQNSLIQQLKNDGTIVEGKKNEPTD